MLQIIHLHFTVIVYKRC